MLIRERVLNNTKVGVFVVKKSIRNPLHPLALVIAIAVIGTLLLTVYENSRNRVELTVYVPPILANLVHEYSKVFEEKYGVKVSLVVQPTGVLLKRVEASGEGDVLFTADHVFMEVAIARNFVDPATVRVVSYVLPVIAVSKRSNISLNSIRDLLTGNFTIGISDPQVSPFGRIAVEILKKTGIYEVASHRVVVFSDIGTLATQLISGGVETAILPHVTKYWYPSEIKVMWLEPSVVNTSVTCQLAAVTTQSRNRELAELFIKEFIDYLFKRGIQNHGYARSVRELSLISPYDYLEIVLPGLCRP